MTKDSSRFPNTGKHAGRPPRKTELRRGAFGNGQPPQSCGSKADLSGIDLRAACRDLVDDIRKSGAKDTLPSKRRR